MGASLILSIVHELKAILKCVPTVSPTPSRVSLSLGTEDPFYQVGQIYLLRACYPEGSASANTLLKLPPNSFARSSSVQPLA